MEKQLVKWVCRLLTPIVAPHEETHRMKINKKGQLVRKDLTPAGYKALSVYKLVFQGKHTRFVVQTVNRSAKGGIAGFLVPQKRCVGCNVLLGKRDLSEDAQVCRTCLPRKHEVARALDARNAALHAERQAAWLTCQACVGMQAETLAPDRVPCSNVDCGNFFRRTRLDMDIEDLAPKLIK